MKRIAVIEDNPDNRLLLNAILGDLYEIEEYDAGEPALASMNQSPPELVLLDISLPGLDGVEVLKRIRASDRLRHLPVVALTAHAMSGDREKYLGAGFNDYVTKPIVDEAVLLDVLAKHLR
jgi:two-component system cell cycle response regulator